MVWAEISDVMFIAEKATNRKRAICFILLRCRFPGQIRSDKDRYFTGLV